jgi:hypothetical protein
MERTSRLIGVGRSPQRYRAKSTRLVPTMPIEFENSLRAAARRLRRAISGSACLAVCLAGCLHPQEVPTDRPRTVQDAHDRLARPQLYRGGLLTLSELEQINRAIADRAVTLMDTAADATLKDNPDPNQRREVLRIRAYMSESAYNIVTRLDPLSQLADLVVLSSLTRRVWVDEHHMKQQFGERGAAFESAICKLDDEVLNTAKQALRPEQLEAIKRWIGEFRAAYPEVTMTAFVSFEAIARMRGGLASGAGKSDGDLMKEIQIARNSIDESVLLGERGFWYLKRWPRIVSWHAERLVGNLGARPDLVTALQDFTRLSESGERVSHTVAAFPDVVQREREAILSQLDTRAENINSTIRLFNDAVEQLKDLVGKLRDTGTVGRNVLQESQEASRSFKDLVLSLDGMMARLERLSNAPSEGPPFDIKDYSRALEDMTHAACEMTEFVNSTGNLLDSQAWSVRLAEIDELLQRKLDNATVGSSTVFDRALYRGIILIAIFFIGLCLYKVYAVRMERRVLGRHAGS